MRVWRHHWPFPSRPSRSDIPRTNSCGSFSGRVPKKGGNEQVDQVTIRIYLRYMPSAQNVALVTSDSAVERHRFHLASASGLCTLGIRDRRVMPTFMHRYWPVWAFFHLKRRVKRIPELQVGPSLHRLSIRVYMILSGLGKHESRRGEDWHTVCTYTFN